MNLPPLTYLTFDSVAEGVGRSQVLPYVERLGRAGLRVTVHSLEKGPPPADVARRLSDAGVTWHHHPFGVGGAIGGLARVLRGARYVMGDELVHARTDPSAAAALLARCRHWVWDIRSFWRQERVDQGMLRPGSPEDRILRQVEAAAARSSSAIISLSQRAIDVLADVHGEEIATKSRVVTTCTDLERFRLRPLPPPDPLRLLLSGSLNKLYDVPGMVRFFQRLTARRPTLLTVLTPQVSPWDEELRVAGAAIDHAAADDMPDHVGAHHVGLSLRRLEFASSSAAATPTKIGEYLGCGRPVVVSQGLGDMDRLLAEYRCGVVISDLSDPALDRAADELDGLLSDPETPRRCRALAEDWFSLERGVEQLIASYESAVGIRRSG